MEVGKSKKPPLEAKAVKGVYGVRGGKPAVVGGLARTAKGVVGSSGEWGAFSAPGKIVYIHHMSERRLLTGCQQRYLLDKLLYHITSQNVLRVSPETHDIVCSQALRDVNHKLGSISFARVCQGSQGLREQVVEIRRKCRLYSVNSL